MSVPPQVPLELAVHRVYEPDLGWCVRVAVASQITDPTDPDAVAGAVVSAPVRAVLRVGWTLSVAGVPVCDLPYDTALGLVVDDDDCDW